MVNKSFTGKALFLCANLVNFSEIYNKGKFCLNYDYNIVGFSDDVKAFPTT